MNEQELPTCVNVIKPFVGFTADNGDGPDTTLFNDTGCRARGSDTLRVTVDDGVVLPRRDRDWVRFAAGLQIYTNIKWKRRQVPLCEEEVTE